MTLSQLRRRTLSRATSTYWHWVERSIGWGTLIWALAWLVFYAVAASQVVIFNVKPRESVAVSVVLLVLLTLGLGFNVLTRRTPSVILNRRDLYRVGLAPLSPVSVLAWEFTYSRLMLFALGVLAGLVWWLFAYAFFRLQPFFAPVALGLWFATVVDWGWLRYVGSSRTWVFPALLVLGALLERLIGVGTASALWNTNPLGLLLPALTLGLGIVFAKQTLLESYPPLFASHSLVLSQLRAMNLTAVMVQRPPDPDVRRRLLRTLRQGSPAIRPDRYLSIPRGMGALGFIAWRVALTLYRRGPAEQLALLSQIAFIVFSSANLVSGLAGTLLLMVALSSLAPRLLGPSFPPLPVDPTTRTLGRILPAALILALVAAIALVSSLFVPSIQTLTIAVAFLHALIALSVLEKLSQRFGTPPASFDVSFGAALVAVLPEVTLSILGMGMGNLLPVQLGLLLLLLWQPFL